MIFAEWHHYYRSLVSTFPQSTPAQQPASTARTVFTLRPNFGDTPPPATKFIILNFYRRWEKNKVKEYQMMVIFRNPAKLLTLWELNVFLIFSGSVFLFRLHLKAGQFQRKVLNSQNYLHCFQHQKQALWDSKSKRFPLTSHSEVHSQIEVKETLFLLIQLDNMRLHQISSKLETL